MPFFSKRTARPKPRRLTFTLAEAGHTYDDGVTGLSPTSLTISERRVAVIGLNGTGKSTLLGLLDGTLKATCGTVTIAGSADGDAAGGEQETLDPRSKRDMKRVDELIGRVRREEIPESFNRSENIADAVDALLKKHHVPDSERRAIIGDLFAHFDLASAAREPASALNGEQRHLLAIAAALSLRPSCVVADEPSKGLDEIGTAHVAKALFSYDSQVIFATHDTDMIVRPEYAIDRTLVLDDRTVVFDGTPTDAVAFYTDLIRRHYESLR
ncbi:ATP-binding cassette domain-containing protein [Bifidobacterium sp. 64T4]|uniref:ATP-binding cassette domain-containing protein n=1 Tax=Bifidobacterium pongonis TaxID=2834432 RepID=UPI001C58EB45|nr:ATP-binding cassette domain-containing protein [Bifidobacterium pongonis]MBW3094581.1 ATP-binding cassette domain-containing protein [Bifidobacterium pongonis]